MREVTLHPYLFFIGNCREAMEFYKSIFGGELEIMENQGELAGTIMHAHLKGGLVSFMASDGTRRTPYEPSFITMSLNGSDSSQLSKVFDLLSEGGTVTYPMKLEVWGDMYGTVTDKFGVDWMVNISAH